jgi:serine protease Do
VDVTLSDGRKFEKAKVLGRDERTDIAVVKIDATDLPTVKLGESSSVRVGDWAIAVGNPFGLDHTVTVGVISAKSRELNLAAGGDSRTDYLQTDASINPGNSGGPLLDIYGRVIGINNAIYSESGGNQGIGFAVPVDTARFIADKLVKDGRVRRAYLGVEISNVEDRGSAFGLPSGLKGVLIERITNPNTPGAKAGLQPGDVITKFNGKPVDKSNELQALVGNSPIGSTVTLTVLRDGKTLDLKAVLEELKDQSATDTSGPAPNSAPGELQGTQSAELGLSLRPVTAGVAQALGIKATTGVAILSVKPGSPADDAGLQRGDVIERVAQTPVTTVEGVTDAVKAILGRQTTNKKVALYVNRNGQRSFVILSID